MLKRKVFIVSNDLFNQGPSALTIVIPLTSKYKGILSHVEIKPPHGGLNLISYAECEQIRCISISRLKRRLGSVNERIFDEVHSWLTPADTKILKIKSTPPF